MPRLLLLLYKCIGVAYSCPLLQFDFVVRYFWRVRDQFRFYALSGNCFFIPRLDCSFSPPTSSPLASVSF